MTDDPLLSRMASLADAVRVRLLHVLCDHELGVTEIRDVIQLPQSTVSRHLKVLSDDGWITARRDGTNRLYQLIPDELDPTARKLWHIARDGSDPWPSVRQDRLRLDRLLKDRQVDGPAFFAAAAVEWDRLRRELYGDRFSVTAMLALLPAHYVVADLGCGTGNLTAELAPHVARVIGVDSSQAMLKAARKRTSDHQNVDLKKGDLSTLPIESQTCDAALLVLALTYLPNPAAAVSEMARILKPAGRGVIVDLLPHDRDDFRRTTGQTAMGLNPAAVAEMMTAAGMTPAPPQSLPPEPNVKGPALFIVTGTRR